MNSAFQSVQLNIRLHQRQQYVQIRDSNRNSGRYQRQRQPHQPSACSKFHHMFPVQNRRIICVFSRKVLSEHYCCRPQFTSAANGRLFLKQDWTWQTGAVRFIGASWAASNKPSSLVATAVEGDAEVTSVVSSSLYKQLNIGWLDYREGQTTAGGVSKRGQCSLILERETLEFAKQKSIADLLCSALKRDLPTSPLLSGARHNGSPSAAAAAGAGAAVVSPTASASSQRRVRFISINDYVSEHPQSTSLTALETDLQQRLAALRTELIDLINTKYADFVSLTTNLVGLDDALDSLRQPLEAIDTKQVVPLLEWLEGQHREMEEKLKQRETCITLVQQSYNSATQSNISASSPWLKSASAQSLQQCLNIYIIIDNTRRAETLIREKVVRPTLAHIIEDSTFSSGSAIHTGTGFTRLLGSIESFISAQISPVCKVSCSGNGDSTLTTALNLPSTAVWNEVSEILSNKCAVVFAPAIPSTFRDNHAAAMSFIRMIEDLCGTAAQLNELRESESYKAFVKRWQLQAYFAVRHRHIVTMLLDEQQNQQSDVNEDIFSPEELSSIDSIMATLTLPDNLDTATVASLRAIATCWSPNIFLLPLASQFWQLTLQIIVRQGTCYDEQVQSLKSAEWAAESDTARDKWMTALVQIARNVQLFISSALKIFHSQICNVVPDIAASVKENEPESYLADFNDILDDAAAVIPSAAELIAAVMIPRCTETLKAVKGITGEFRATNRPPPTQPSAYVSRILKPVEQFYVDYLGVSVATTNIDNMSQQFAASVNELIEQVRKTEESLDRLRKTRLLSTAAQDSPRPSDAQPRGRLMTGLKMLQQQQQQMSRNPGGNLANKPSSLSSSSSSLAAANGADSMSDEDKLAE
ncbi:hypothetical protein GQ42DRAFT_176059 [Ramicandelaber brevisporus]|nr:hypothetical protein GQ42DRAFT_176059 [Ramicandelaber brevisporus]